MNALIIEDDDDEREFLRKGISSMGYACTLAATGSDGFAKLCENKYDLAIVDLMLPGMDGRDLLRQARERGIETPVIIVSALGSTNDRILGLNIGADAYLPKPFEMSELRAHINAFNRRFSTTHERTLDSHGIVLDTISRTCVRGGRSILLSRVEFAILECLMRHRNSLVPRSLLLGKAWGYDHDYTTDIITPHISRLKSKLTANGEDNPIESLRGEGYVFRA